MKKARMNRSNIDDKFLRSLGITPAEARRCVAVSEIPEQVFEKYLERLIKRGPEMLDNDILKFARKSANQRK
jgi:hypothetical protein